MKKWTIPAIVVGALLVLAMIFGGVYNGLVSSRESLNSKWAAVESQYQRRSDLIPNLVNTVKGVADFEQTTLTQVIDARSKATSINVNADNPQDLQRFQEAQGEVSSALSRLLAVSENYPQLRATESFRALQDQLEGTENRIAVARNDFNAEARVYNTKVQTFPTNILAGMLGFQARPYFEADKGAETAPTVDFGTNEPAAENQ